MSLKLSERLSNARVFSFFPVSPKTGPIVIDVAVLISEVEVLERDHLIAIAELSELRVRFRQIIENSENGIKCIDKVLGVSEEAKQE